MPLRGSFLYEFSEASGNLSIRWRRGYCRPRLPSHRLDEFPVGYSLAVCSPALPASASPTGSEYALQSSCWSSTFHRTDTSVLTLCVTPGGKRSCPLNIWSTKATPTPTCWWIANAITASLLSGRLPLIRAGKLARVKVLINPALWSIGTNKWSPVRLENRASRGCPILIQKTAWFGRHALPERTAHRVRCADAVPSPRLNHALLAYSLVSTMRHCKRRANTKRQRSSIRSTRHEPESKALTSKLYAVAVFATVVTSA